MLYTATNTNSKPIMGQFQLGKKMTAFLWAITLGVVGVNLYTISNAVFGEGMVSHPVHNLSLFALSLFALSLFWQFICLQFSIVLL
jgi:hypothetical protein